MFSQHRAFLLQSLTMKLNARHLVLDLLLAAQGQPLTAREAIAACRIFEISENSVRVALVRLSADGLILAAGRGSYQLAPAAMELAGDVATWRSAEQRLRAWSGNYLVIHTGHLGRSDRTALRYRERALSMLGFCELERDLYVRPDNLVADLDAIRHRLTVLGMADAAPLFVGSQWSREDQTRLNTLWDGRKLNQQYRQLHEQLTTWMANADSLEPEVAARECFLMGSKAIRAVVYDPLLPEPLVDAQARQTFLDTVRAYDQLGHRIWAQIYRNG